VKRLASRLGNRGFRVVSLSGELSQAERSNALQWMRDGRARVCVATDVAARGIDLPNLDLVIHADLPSNPETLLHRSGRTGRAGRKGVCALIVPHHRRGSANRLLKVAGVKAEPMRAPGAADIDLLIRERVVSTPALSEPAEEAETSLGAELVARFGAERVAAALVKHLLAQFPSPEDLSDAAPAPYDPKTGERPQTRFETGSWFTVSVGRKKRAEPRWLLPILCKAGGVTKAAIGSIRILEDETRFEVAPEHAEAYARAVSKGPVEKGVIIRPLADDAPPAPPRDHRPPMRDKPRPKKKSFDKPAASAPGAARAEKRKLKKARKKLKAE
jgi:ATP-dependent RNA helicase DeaD